jgi:uncharacterized protein (DUF1501 family)
MNQNLPEFVVLVTRKPTDQPLYARLWGNGFLDSRYQGVRFSSGSDPVFYLSNPDGICGSGRRAMLDKINALNRLQYKAELDPEIESRIAQYEMAYRMQTSVPEVTDVSKEPKNVLDLYGPQAAQPGTFAANCLLARRLAERGVRYIQCTHSYKWDQHGQLYVKHTENAKEVDKPIAGLLKDLRQRGMLDDTIVVWATEFGRTPGAENSNGRDHHPFGFSTWMAGGGIKEGVIHGRTDDIGFHAVESRHYVTDIHATVLHQLGLNPRKLDVPGRKRLDIDYGQPIRGILV